MDLFTPRDARYSKRVSEIKTQVQNQLGLTEDATVMVTELACLEDGCPPIETVIAVFQTATPRLQFKLHRSIDQITERGVQEICKRKINQVSEMDHGSCRS